MLCPHVEIMITFYLDLWSDKQVHTAVEIDLNMNANAQCIGYSEAA